MAHWTTLFSHVSGRLEIRKLCNFCGSSSSWGQIQAVSCSWCFHCFICEFIKCLLFFLKFFCKQTRKEPCNPIYVWAAGWATLPWKQLELILSALSALPSWRHVDIMFVKTSPFSDDMGGGGRRKNWLQYSWAPDWVVQVSFVQQTSWQMTVRCDHGCGMWHALWKRFFSTLKKKKKKKRCDSLYTVTCQDNNRLRRQFGAGFPLLLQPPLQPARQGEFQWTLSLGCTES